jgi:hypothetical protein
MTKLTHSKLYPPKVQRLECNFLHEILVLVNLTKKHNVQHAMITKGGWWWTFGEATCVFRTRKVQFLHEVSRQLQSHQNFEFVDGYLQ